MEFDVQAMKRFVAAAQRGGTEAASHGERVARKLAKAIHEIGDDFAMLDEELIQGAFSVALGLHGPWPTDAVKESILRMAKQAALGLP